MTAPGQFGHGTHGTRYPCLFCHVPHKEDYTASDDAKRFCASCRALRALCEQAIEGAMVATDPDLPHCIIVPANLPRRQAA